MFLDEMHAIEQRMRLEARRESWPPGSGDQPCESIHPDWFAWASEPDPRHCHACGRTYATMESLRRHMCRAKGLRRSQQ